ncbi:MAG: hypothetical protein IPK82_03340 [Polyangiaceae bacterium]|nr:hypothetical protein [Polyangiaceae bacterium]
MSLSACLVTSSPSFEDPEQTPPFLIGPTAQPTLHEIFVVDRSGPSEFPFSARVVSEDAGQDVLGRLVLDYGVPLPGPEIPFQEVLDDTIVAASTIDDESRTLTTQWYPTDETLGCHTVTLFASHAFNVDTRCPADPKDFDSLTWTVIVCDSVMAPCCDPTPPPGEPGCADLKCPEVDPTARCDSAQ